MSTAMYASLHHLETTPIRAAASANDGVEWITLFFGGDAELTIFMPLVRAQRLADAINAAEEITKAEAEAADTADPIAEKEVVF